jgi:hypothetical protein
MLLWAFPFLTTSLTSSPSTLFVVLSPSLPCHCEPKAWQEAKQSHNAQGKLGEESRLHTPLFAKGQKPGGPHPPVPVTPTRQGTYWMQANANIKMQKAK